ncbi:hypothetical protein BST61_g2771 [Cercospora zeina]
MVTSGYQSLHTVGTIITLRSKTPDNVPRTIQAKIIHLHEPFTLSCVATVEINASDLDLTNPPVNPITAILKLYDRRFATQLRKDERIEPWSQAIEQAYIDTVKNGEAAEFIRKLCDDDIDFEEPDEGWSAAENEAYLHNMCSELFSTETKAYEILRALQGKQVPRLYSTVSLSLDSGELEESCEQAKHLSSISGILLEYIPGPTLSNMTEVIPQESWQADGRTLCWYPHVYCVRLLSTT